MTTGTEANTPSNVIASGQISDEMPMRAVLKLVTLSGDVTYGVLRILSKDVRGHIGIQGGRLITGAHITSKQEYGRSALRQLLATKKGMFAFIAVEKQQPELRQSLNVGVTELLNWRRNDDESIPELTEVLDAAFAHGATTTGEFVMMSDEQASQSQLFKETEEQFAAYWGEEDPQAVSGKLPTLGSILGSQKTTASPAPQIRFSGQPSTQQTGSGNPTGNTPRIVPPPPPAPPPAPPMQPRPMQPTPPVGAGLAPPAQPAPSVPDQSTSGRFTAADLDAIPAPKADAPDTARHGLLGARTGGHNRPAAMGTPIAPGSVPQKANDQQPGEEPEKPTPEKTRQQKQIDLRTSQRMQSMATEEDDENYVAPVQEAKSISRNAVIGGLLGVGMLLVLAQQSFQALTYKQQMDTGLDALRAGKNEIALVAFTQAMNSNRGDVKARFYKAVTETKLRMGNEALDDLNIVIAAQPDNKLAWTARATLFNRFKKYEQAIADCDEIIKRDKGYLDAYRVRAVALNALGRYPETLSDCKFFLTLHPQKDAARAEVLANQAYAFYQKRELDQAIASYSEAIECEPTNPVWYASRAVVNKGAHDWKNAVADVTKAIEMSPGDVSLFKIRGICYAGLGDAERSADDLNKLVKYNPSVENHRMRGNARLAIHDYKGALEDFDFVMGAKPNDAEARAKYQQCKLGLQGLAKPVHALDEVVKDGATTAEVKNEPVNLKLPEPELVRRGYDLMLKGDAEKAEQYLIEAVRKKPNDASARRYLAYTLVEAGANEQAAQQFAALAKVQPLPPGDMLMYAKSLVDGNKVGEGIHIYYAMVTADPLNDRARKALIEALIQSGASGKAKQLAEEGLLKSPAMASTYQELLKQCK